MIEILRFLHQEEWDPREVIPDISIVSVVSSLGRPMIDREGFTQLCAK